MQGRPFSQQEADMKWRVEEMRKHREAEAAKAAADPAAATAAAAKAAAAAEPPDPAFCARVQIRGTDDNEAAEAQQAAWENAVRVDASANGGMVPPRASGQRRAVRLFTDKTLPPAADTESELNGLIAECRFLMREVAYNSACLTYDPKDRIDFMASAQGMALAGAKVGETVAQLRGASARSVETRRHELIYVHEARRTLPPPLWGRKVTNNDQPLVCR